MGLIMSSSEFVADTLSKLITKSSSSTDFRKNSRVLSMFPDIASTLLKLSIGSPDIECSVLLANLIEGWIKFAAKVFPKHYFGHFLVDAC